MVLTLYFDVQRAIHPEAQGEVSPWGKGEEKVLNQQFEVQ